MVSAAGENVGELVMGEKDALNVPRRLEPLHDPLSASGRLMGGFGPIIEALVLPMLDPGHDLPLGCGVALELIGDKHTRGSTLLFEELAEQAFGGLLVAPVLDENIENDAFWSTARQSQCFLAAMLLTTSSRMPFVATARRSLTDAVGEYPPEFEAPLPIVSWVTE